MTRDDVIKNSGKQVIINGDGDLAMCREIRPFIRVPGFHIVKLTRAGMAYLRNDKGYTVSVPPKNVDLNWQGAYPPDGTYIDPTTLRLKKRIGQVYISDDLLE